MIIPILRVLLFYIPCIIFMYIIIITIAYNHSTLEGGGSIFPLVPSKLHDATFQMTQSYHTPPQ